MVGNISQFVICIPIDRQLSLFLFGNITDNPVMTIHVKILVWTYIFSSLLSKYLRVEWLDHIIGTITNF